jgi:hypothetical protein
MLTKLLPVALLGTLCLAGCSGAPSGSSELSPTSAKPAQHSQAGETKVQTNLAKLGPEDRKLAEEQRFCAVESENPLGAMGVPVKVVVGDQPVFLCCKGCKEEALAHPDRTLARVRELKEKAQTPPK